jgi:hypothetical protein
MSANKKEYMQGYYKRPEVIDRRKEQKAAKKREREIERNKLLSPSELRIKQLRQLRYQERDLPPVSNADYCPLFVRCRKCFAHANQVCEKENCPVLKIQDEESQKCGKPTLIPQY